MDRTTEFCSITHVENNKKTKPPLIKEADLIYMDICEFVNELKLDRNRYLHEGSNRSQFMSETDRNNFDYEATKILRRLLNRINTLKELVGKYIKPKWSLLSSSEDGRLLHYGGVVLYLNDIHKDAAKLHIELQNARMEKQTELLKNTLGSTITFSNEAALAMPISEESVLDGSQLELLQVENNDLVTHFDSVSEQAKELGKRLLEIGSLQAEIIQHINSQSETIDNLFDDAAVSATRIAQGNSELQQSKKRSSKAIKLVIIFIYSLSVILLLLHHLRL